MLLPDKVIEDSSVFHVDAKFTGISKICSTPVQLKYSLVRVATF